MDFESILSVAKFTQERYNEMKKTKKSKKIIDLRTDDIICTKSFVFDNAYRIDSFDFHLSTVKINDKFVTRAVIFGKNQSIQVTLSNDKVIIVGGDKPEDDKAIVVSEFLRIDGLIKKYFKK